METKQIQITCPCCEERLVVDVRTQKILKHYGATEVDETGKAVLDEGRWDSASERVRSRKSQSKDVFDAALGKEQTREKDLDDLFTKAQDKIAKRRERIDEE